MLGNSEGSHVRRLAGAFADRGHRVHVVSMKATPPTKGGANLPIPGVSFERFRVPPFGWRHPYRWQRRRSACLRDLFHRYDIVNAHFLMDWGITESIADDGCLVVKAYGSDVDHPPETPPVDESLWAARRELLRSAERIVSPSEAFARKVAAFGDIDPGKIEVLPFGVDVDVFSPRAKTGGDTPRVGFPKGFQPVYGARTMIDAAAHIHAARADVRFDFVGDGPLRAACLSQARSHGLTDAITWIDAQPPEKMPELHARWDVVTIPSVKESFCVAALEAAAMEIPVVASDVGGLPEAVDDGRSGMLVREGDAVAFGNAVLSLLDDAPRRREMGRHARERAADRFEWNACVTRWICLLESTRLSTSPALA